MKRFFSLIVLATFVVSSPFAFGENFFNKVGDTLSGDDDSKPIAPKPKNKKGWVKQDKQLAQKEFEKYHDGGHVVWIAGSNMSYEEQLKYLKSRGAEILGDDHHIQCNNIWYEGAPRGEYCLKTRPVYFPPHMSTYTPNSRIPDSQF